MGTSEYAVPILEALLQIKEIEVTDVITQPDRPAGRKQELKKSPVKIFVEKMMMGEPVHGTKAIKNTQDSGQMSQNVSFNIESDLKINLYQPEKIKNFSDEVVNMIKPEFIIVAAYGQIIPKSILDFPKYKALNFHGSLLPHLRGAVPIHMAILEGLKSTGNTLQVMSEQMDEGPIISARGIQVEKEETFESLLAKLASLAKKQTVEDIPKWLAGELEPAGQDHTRATFCYMKDISKEKAEISFETSAEVAERMTRAFYPWPVAWLKIPNGAYEGKRLKVFKAKVQEVNDLESNEMINNLTRSEFKIFKSGKKLCLGLKDGVLELVEIQLEGKDRAQARNYLYLA